MLVRSLVKPILFTYFLTMPTTREKGVLLELSKARVLLTVDLKLEY